MSKRKQYKAGFKAKVALEALKGEQTVSDAHSDAKRPLFPIQSGHRFRFNPATDSDAKRPVRLGVLLTLPE